MKYFDQSRRQFGSHCILGLGLLSTFNQVATAATYPSKVVRVVVPFPSGGGTEVIGRSLIQAMAEDLGQAMIIDNKPGAGTVIGSDFVAKAGNDGHTLLMTTGALAINASLVANLPYDTLSDFVPIGRICNGPNVIAVRADYASSGNGSAVHLAAELFKMMAKIDIQHIPYKGGGPAYTDLLGGHVDMVFATVGGVGKFLKNGQMRAIALTSSYRVNSYPGLPTISETIPGYAAEVWYGLFAPKGTPPAIVERLNLALSKAANQPKYKEMLINDGLTVSVNTPAEMTMFLKSEVDRWRSVVASQKIQSD